MEGAKLERSAGRIAADDTASEQHLIANNFWQEYLKGIDPVHFPPYLPANKAVPPSEKLEHPCHISNNIDACDELLQPAILLAWALTISQYTDSEEALFGLFNPCKESPGGNIEDRPSPFIPFRAHIRQEDLVRDALFHIRENQAQTIPFHDVGLERIRALSVDTAKACQLQNVLVIGSSPRQDGPIWLGPLTVLCGMDGPSRVAMIEAVFDPKYILEVQVRWALEQFTHNLRQIVMHPEKTLGVIGKACPAHLDQLISWWPQEPDRIEECVHELILKNCVTRPNATAVSAWDGEYTYQELDDLSSSLARLLQRKYAVGPSVYVPVYSERSKHVLIAILAIMRAGKHSYFSQMPSHMVE